ncbi:hypothetical protein [Halobacteriovorax sp. HLS]|uniref:hypothetical protein n=1 Tax=Halobacteriovorax sp. HLS TaxID=2234000 RepID=UPI000FD7374F|nr:hypothetical protein [Halobacteriovorax sp. HLS]
MIKEISIFLIVAVFSNQIFAVGKLATISKSILIESSHSDVFDIVKNTMNDYLWRSEVNHMSSNGEFEIGTIYTEDAHIGFAKNFITRTQLVELKSEDYAFYITPKDSPYYLESLRQVKRIDHNRTLFTYTVKFEASMSKATIGISLPAKVLEKSYGVIMNKYLRSLRNHLEDGESFESLYKP